MRSHRLLSAALRDQSIPEAVQQTLRCALEESVRRSLAQTGELARVAGLFEERGIPMVALKGPLLSHYLYGDLGARTSGDIDLLAKRKDVARIHDVLISQGYRLTSTLHWNSASACLRSRESEVSFESPSEVSIDVHWRLLPRYFASAFDEMDGWESLRTLTLAGRRVHTLAPEPLLLFLCSHGAKHMFERLGWICDVARFLIVTRELDWAATVAAARRTRALRQLSLGVRLAVDLRGAPASAELLPDPAVEPLARAVWNRLLAGATPPVPALESTRLYLRLLETPGHKLRFLSGLYFTPSEAEYRALKFPPRLFSLYYPFRPIRLLWKHVIRRPVRVIVGS